MASATPARIIKVGMAFWPAKTLLRRSSSDCSWPWEKAR